MIPSARPLVRLGLALFPFVLSVPALAAEAVKMGDLPAISNGGLYIAVEKGFF